MERKINEQIFNAFPELESDRLIFRAYKKEDAQLLLNIRSHNAVSKYMDTAIPTRIEDTETRIEGYRNAFNEKKGITW